MQLGQPAPKMTLTDRYDTLVQKEYIHAHPNTDISWALKNTTKLLNHLLQQTASRHSKQDQDNKRKFIQINMYEAKSWREFNVLLK